MAFALRCFAGKIFRPLRSLCVAPSGAHYFRTTASVMSSEDDDHSGQRVFPCFFSDGPFATIPLSMNQLVNEEFMENFSEEDGVPDITEDENGLYLNTKLPGLTKEDINISVKGYTITMKADEQKSKFFFLMHLIPPKAYKFNEIKAVMKNGFLKVTVPRFKDEEREDIFTVQID